MPRVRLRGGEVDGLELHYTAEGRGPAIVLVHGLGSFAESWRHNVPALADRATVYALDLPGFGRSAKPRASYGLPYFAAVVHAFLDALGIAQASLVGHSLGGAVAAAATLRHPLRIDRLALVGAVVPGFAFRPSWIYRLMALPGLGDCLGWLGCAPLYKAAVARCFHAPARSEVEFFVEHAYAERAGAEGRAAYLATLRGVRRDFEVHAAGYRRALESLDTRVLLIHGLQDRVVPVRHSAELGAALPDATVRWVEACGHFPQIEHARTVNGWLQEFLVVRPARR